MRRWALVAMAAALGGYWGIAGAQGPGGFITLTSDYLYRGATQSAHEPALQADAHYYGARGWLAGLWASTVRFQPDAPSGVELDPYLGITQSFSDDWSARLTLAYHAFPGANPGPRYHYSELAGTLILHSTWFLTAVVSPDTIVETGGYGEVRRTALSGDVAWHGSLGHGLSANVGAGYYRLQRPHSDGYAYGSAGVARDWGRVHLDVSLIGVNGAARDFYYRHEAQNRLVGSILWAF